MNSEQVIRQEFEAAGITIIFQLGRITVRRKKSEFFLRIVKSVYVDSKVSSVGEGQEAKWTLMPDIAGMS